jgi:hypothetical protein
LKDLEISTEFISLLKRAGEMQGFRCIPWYGGTRRISRNIIEILGKIDCLVYFKVRSAEPFRWGVTANRIEELNRSNIKWFIVLLYESPETGYLLSSEDVSRYRSIWACGRDGDYKVGPGSYLQFNRPFNSFSEFVDSLINNCNGM